MKFPLALVPIVIGLLVLGFWEWFVRSEIGRAHV